MKVRQSTRATGRPITSGLSLVGLNDIKGAVKFEKR